MGSMKRTATILFSIGMIAMGVALLLASGCFPYSGYAPQFLVQAGDPLGTDVGTRHRSNGLHAGFPQVPSTCNHIRRQLLGKRRSFLLHAKIWAQRCPRDTRFQNQYIPDLLSDK